MIPEGAIKVLNLGYVRLVDVLGTDETVANAARVSYNKQTKSLTDKDIRLIKFLAKEGHTSPFRHCMLQFEVYAPLMVARQWFKHLTGSAPQDPLFAWNESSRRYVTEEPEFYVPDYNGWRKAPENKKQGSGGPLEGGPGSWFTEELIGTIHEGMGHYNEAMKAGMTPEQARMFLPAYAMYVRWYWTCSLQAALHFLDLRLGHGAQYEIIEYAKAVADFVKQKFPVSYEAWTKESSVPIVEQR